MEVMEMNATIAEFMGWKFHDDDSITFPDGYFIDEEKEIGCTTIDEFSYHESYYWIITVWVKFRELNISEDDENFMKHLEWCSVMQKVITLSDIEDAHKLLHEAIQWYNSIN